MRIAAALTLGQLCLHIHQKIERFLFRLLLLAWTMFDFSGNHSFQFVLAVPCAQSAEPDKSLLPCALDGGVFSAFDIIALLLQLLQKILVVLGLLSQNAVNYTA